MFLMFLTFIVVLAGMAALVWLGCQRVAVHLRDKPDATKAVVEHVLMPLLGRNDTPGSGASRDGFEVGPDTQRS